MRSSLHLAPLLTFALLLAACTGAQRRDEAPVGPPAFGPDLRADAPQDPADAPWRAWLLQGDEARAEDLLSVRADAQGDDLTPDTLALRAELHLHQGRLTLGYQDHLRLLRHHPTHPFAATSALRVWQLREEVPAWADDVNQLTRDLAKAPADPAARTWLAFMRLHAAWAHARQPQDDPFQGPPLFDGAPVGFPQQWRLLEPLDIFAALGWEPAHDLLKGHRALPDALERDGVTRRARSLVIDTPGAHVAFRFTGVHALETWMDLRQATDVTAQLLTPAPFELTIDDHVVAARRPGEPAERLRFARHLTLQPGLHRVRLLLATPTGAEPFTLLITPTDGDDLQATFSPTPPRDEDTAPLTLHAQTPDPYGALDPEITRGHPALLWLSALAATEAGTIPQGRRDLEALAALAPDFAPRFLATANLESNDPALPVATREERRFAALNSAVANDPEAHLARLHLVGLLYANDQTDQALQHLDTLQQHLPGEFAVHWRRFQLFRDRGWTPEAEDALRTALDLNPADCRLITARWDAWERLQTWPRPDALPADLFGCDTTFERLAQRGRLDAAQALVARNPGTPSHLQRLAVLLHGAGRFDEADQAWTRAADLSTDPTDAHLQRLDALLARGQGAQAAQLLQNLREQRPGDYSLLRRQQDLQRTRVLADLDQDGLALIRDFLANPRGQDASAVYVLDFAATRVFPDGASLTVTHNVIRVLNKEGIDQYGELEIPGNALLLSARTVKPDLTIREPEPIFGKPTLSMPSLEPGDFIEFSYLQGDTGSLLRSGAYLGFRWFFNIFDAALLRSEYVIELPAAWSVAVDRRHGAPEPTITRTPTTQTLRFLSTDGPRVISEPASAPSGEYLPSVRVASAFSWDDYRRTWRDQLILHAAPADNLQRLLNDARRDLGARADDPEALASALYHLVRDRVQDDSSGPFAQPASQVLAAAEGDRLIVLLALYQLAGLDAEIALARPYAEDASTSELPNAEPFNAPLLRLNLPSGVRWLDPALPHAPFAFLPPALRDAQALRLGALQPQDDRFTRTPPLQPGDELRTVEIDLHLNAQGDAQGEATEVYRGAAAALLRRILDQYPDRDKLRQDFAQTLTPSFASPEITQLTFEDEKDDTKPLTLRYTFTTPNLARRDGDRLIIDRAQLPSRLQATAASLAERRLPLLLNEGAEANFTVRYHLPDGLTPQRPVDPVHLDTPFGAYDLKPLDNLPPGVVGWTRSVRIPTQRVAPKDYPQLRHFARAIDEADRVRLTAAPR